MGMEIDPGEETDTPMEISDADRATQVVDALLGPPPEPTEPQAVDMDRSQGDQSYSGPPATSVEPTATGEDEEGFAPVPTNKKPKATEPQITPKPLNHTRKTVCANNRPYMEFWFLRIVVEPQDIKDGKVMDWIVNRLKNGFFKQAKSIDSQFVLYKYRAQEQERDAILDMASFPKSFRTLQGEGPSSTPKFRNCYLFGLKTWDHKGRTMKIPTELRVGYADRDLLPKMQEWVRTQIPQPWLSVKSLQAPDTQDAGFIFFGNPFMDVSHIQKILDRVFLNCAIHHECPPPRIAITNKYFQEAKYDPNRRGDSNPLRQNRGLHIEALTSEMSTARSFTKVALTSDDWKQYTNAECYLFLTYIKGGDSKDNKRAANGVTQHKDFLQTLDYATTRDIKSVDYANPDVMQVEGSRKSTLRYWLLRMELEVEERVWEGEGPERQRKTVTKSDKLFLSVDEKHGEPGTWVFVFPKAYEKEAHNRIKGLYLHIKNTLMESGMHSPADVDQDIACWFTAGAIEEAKHMVYEDGQILTADDIYERDALQQLRQHSWITGMEVVQSDNSDNQTPRIVRPPRTDGSLCTRLSSNTNVLARQLTSALQHGQTMDSPDALQDDGVGDHQNGG